MTCKGKGARKFAPVTVFSSQVVGKPRTMNARRPINYLRSYRLRWGLSQKELAYLLGWDRPDIISRIEKKQRPPNLTLAMACFILFDVQAAELFPDLSAGIEHLMMARVQDLYETIQGDPSRKRRRKLSCSKPPSSALSEGSAPLTGSPDESGRKHREKGLARAGNARVRRGMIQLAWRFLMFQKNSALAQWFRQRTENAPRTRL